MFRMRTLTAAVVLLAAGALVVSASAQTPSQYDQTTQEAQTTPQAQTAQEPQAQAQPQGTKITGTVVSVTDEMLVIRMSDGTSRTLFIDTQSDVPTDLSAGETVTVAYHADPVAPDRLMVASVEVSSSEMDSRSELPQTASPLAWLLLLGIAATAGYFTLGRTQEAR